MNNYYVNEGDFWRSFNDVKSSLNYFERDRMIDDYYSINNDFITQHYIIVKNEEINRLKKSTQKYNKHKLSVKNMCRFFEDSCYDIKNLMGDYYYMDFKNDEENFILNLNLDLIGKVEFQINIDNRQNEINYSRFFNCDDMSDSIYKETKFQFYRGVVIGSENYEVINKNNQTYSMDRIGKSNVIKYDIVKCFNNYLNKFSKNTKNI